MCKDFWFKNKLNQHRSQTFPHVRVFGQATTCTKFKSVPLVAFTKLWKKG